MSQAAEKSHIPDGQLVKLTTEKLQELYAERRELSDRLIHMYRGGSGTTEERDRLPNRSRIMTRPTGS